MKKIFKSWHQFWYSYHVKQLHKLGENLDHLIPDEVLIDTAKAFAQSAKLKIG